MNTISIASFNTCGIPFFSDNYRRRISKIANLLNRSNMDVIHLQEVFTYDQIVVLKSKLTNYSYFIFSPDIVGPKGGLLTVSRIPMDKVTYQTFKKRGFIFDLSIVQILMNKGILLTKFKNAPLWFINTHFTANMSQDWSRDSKYSQILQSQMSEFLALFNSLAKDQKIVIASGDFNITKHSFLGRILHKNRLLKNAFGKDSLPTMHKEYTTYDSTVPCIDYIFVNNSRNITIKNTKRTFNKKITLTENKQIYLSDHICLQTTLLVNY